MHNNVLQLLDNIVNVCEEENRTEKQLHSAEFEPSSSFSWCHEYSHSAIKQIWKML